VIYAIIQFESVAITVKTARCRRKLQWVYRNLLRIARWSLR